MKLKNKNVEEEHTKEEVIVEEEFTKEETIKEKIRFSSCGNLMLQSNNINWVEIPDKKGVKGVLCDDCKRYADRGDLVTLKTAVVDRDGDLNNVPLRDVHTE